MARYGPTSPAIDGDAAWRALAARDERLDGRLYVGVTSTGVYCRPVCRVRTPRRENCRFFGSAAEAEAAGFRACLKCRPAVGTPPAWSAMDASRTLAREAARWLDEHFAAAPAGPGRAQAVTGAPRTQIARLAAHLGVSGRHLRRIFTAEHGVAPLAYAQARRLALARTLLVETTLPVTQIALASGYASLHRFNAAFAGGHGCAPTRLRRDAAALARGDPAAAGQAASTSQAPTAAGPATDVAGRAGAARATTLPCASRRAGIGAPGPEGTP